MTAPSAYAQCGWRGCSRRPFSSAPICPAHRQVSVAMLTGAEPAVVVALLAAAGEKRRPWRLPTGQEGA